MVIDQQLMEVIENPDSEDFPSPAKVSQTFYAGFNNHMKSGLLRQERPNILIERVEGEVGVNTDFD